MNTGQTIFSQLMQHLPHKKFSKYVKRYEGEKYVKSFSCMDQFLCMAFAQLTHRESLRDIECCLRANHTKLYHMGIRGHVARSTLAHANEKRDYRIWANFAGVMIETARKLYSADTFGVDISETVYAFDSTTIDLCLSLFPWAQFRRNKAAVKMHTLLDMRGNIPTMIFITTGRVHDVNILDELPVQAGAFYILDRGYLDFARLYRLHCGLSFFITRAKHNTRYRRMYSNPADKQSGVKCDQIVTLTGYYSKRDYPDKLRIVKYYDSETDKRLTFLTNNLSLPALTVAKLYKCRWQVELFFKWIKQHLRIKSFFGTSENAVKTQIWIAVSIYVLVAIVKKRLKLEASLYTILQILSISLFEKIPILQALTQFNQPSDIPDNDNQLNLFAF